MIVSNPTATRTRELNSLAVKGLLSMYDSENHLFCYRLRHTRHGLVREGLSHRYSVMALLGVHALEEAGVRCPLDSKVAFESCARDTGWIRGIGDLGLLMWLMALRAPERLDELFHRFRLHTCLDRFEDASESRTMELAWFLAGLCHASLASPDNPWPLGDLAAETFQRLQDNRGKSGLFGHLATTKSLAGFVRGRTGTFADQIYPIYALSKFSIAFRLDEPAESALECAAAICRLQGELGQWWRFYDAPTGRVVSRYPVYSVDQHGVAPLALFELERATGRGFEESIYRGLDWIYGANELGEDLRTPSNELIWSCILPRNHRRKYWDTALSFLRRTDDSVPVAGLHVLRESRPYELGLLLCSFAKYGVAEI